LKPQTILDQSWNLNCEAGLKLLEAAKPLIKLFFLCFKIGRAYSKV